MRQARVSKLVEGLKLHAQPSLSSKILDIAASGDTVEVSDEIETQAPRWALVTYKGQQGYMWSSYLVEEAPAPSSTGVEPIIVVEPEPPDHGPPMWMFIAGIATIVIGFIGAVAIVLR